MATRVFPEWSINGRPITGKVSSTPKSSVEVPNDGYGGLGVGLCSILTFCVGLPVEYAVGLLVGRADGLFVGCIDGSFVGSCMG